MTRIESLANNVLEGVRNVFVPDMEYFRLRNWQDYQYPDAMRNAVVHGGSLGLALFGAYSFISGDPVLAGFALGTAASAEVVNGVINLL